MVLRKGLLIVNHQEGSNWETSLSMENARTIIAKWDPLPNGSENKDATPLFTNTRQEAKRYLNAVSNLHSAMQHLLTLDSSSDRLVEACSLMQVAMNRLERELYRVSAEIRDHVDDDNIRHAAAKEDLKAIVECMFFAGYGKECVQIYTKVRKSNVTEALQNLGVEKPRLSKMKKMQWEMFDFKIKTWLNAVKFAVGALFPGERSLINQIFPSSENTTVVESCFAEICKDGAEMLFLFPEIIAKCEKTPEKMFRLLDLYEALSQNWPKIKDIFSYESTSSVRLQVGVSHMKIGEAVRATLSAFESAITKESSKTPVPSGRIHPLTRYAMNYISFLADYSDALTNILIDSPKTPMPESYFRTPKFAAKTPAPPELAERLAWEILLLLCKIDGKAELYKNVALGYLFLANNMQYVVTKARNSKLGSILGDDWLASHDQKVKEYASKYVNMAWSMVEMSLPENPKAAMQPAEASAKFHIFNMAFQEACQMQSTWIAPDLKLRDDIQKSVVSKVVPKYRDFYETNWVGSDSVIAFSPDDLQNHISFILHDVEDPGSITTHFSSFLR
ncbi:hypothetical protein HN51_019120 [Arachis hypogaea]|uniref:Exocyst subunit Exo70 family protein n=1 Tax=Arachis hypogaea TaxID=3818 RepID=A0A445BVL5_ARAHY|nr:exocyst complex component EXO70H1-like [Arachis hypogaea]QHO30679.1 Exocyst subunit exo70 family protein [Arachis hypogaea]RYR42777.1 hypothetical protein Ahy_A08g039217 [Arachis hypogaea]